MRWFGWVQGQYGPDRRRNAFASRGVGSSPAAQQQCSREFDHTISDDGHRVSVCPLPDRPGQLDEQCRQRPVEAAELSREVVGKVIGAEQFSAIDSE